MPESVINQIAAGEIIDRPSSVVRELVDNAVDSGAGEISVYITQGGQSSIRVIDDGSGMSAEDAPMAFQRHATSKLRTAQDLHSITTLGFRGEALPSIAAVSKVRLRTKAKGQVLASELIVEAGALVNSASVPGPVGTEVEVLHLFYNTPARRKFLKSPRADEIRIKQWLTHSSLCRPTIKMRLACEGREVLNLARCESAMDRARLLLSGSVVAFSREAGPCRIEGLLAHPSQAEMDAKALVIVVNRRLVNDRSILRAVKEGFSGTLKEREFPVGYIAVDLPPSEVDVNVHPQKSEVRFRSAQAVFATVRQVVKEAVKDFKGASPLAPLPESLRPGRISSGSNQAVLFAVQNERGPASQPVFPSDSMQLLNGSAAVKRDFSESLGDEKGIEEINPPFTFCALRFIGQLFSCYLLCEWREQFVIIDMHAAHERCNFNLLRQAALIPKAPTQQLILPVDLRLSEAEAFNLRQHAAMLGSFGFDLGFDEPGRVAVRAIPPPLKGADVDQLLREVAAISYDEAADGPWDLYIDRLAAKMACHGSVRAGQILDRQEVSALFAALDSAEFSGACPHGRPVVACFPKFAVERWFGRDR